MDRPFPNLDIGTIYDKKGRLCLKVWKYPRGGFEAVIKPMGIGQKPSTRSSGIQSSRKDDGKGTAGECAGSAPRRARSEIRRYVLSTDCDRMLTLTYRENFDDLQASDGHVTKLLRSMKRWHPDLNYIAVHEYQKRGAIHWHIALNQFVDVKKLRKAWHRIIGELGGSVNIQFFPNPAKQAAYLAKYIGKDLDDEKRGTKKRYKKDRGFRHNIEVIRANSEAELFEAWTKLAGDKWDGSIYESHGTLWLRGY